MRIKHLIVLLIVLVLITQPVSAGFFGDFWNMITGRVTEEVEEVTTEEPAPPEPEPEPIPEEPIAEEPAVEEPIPEEPAIEMPSPEEPVPEELIIEEPTTEEPLPEVPAIEEPVSVPPPEPEPKPEPKRICCATTPVLAEPAPITYKWMLETDCVPLMGENRGIVDNEYCEEKPTLEPAPEPEPEKRCREGDKRNHICRDGTQVPKCECRNNMWVCKISPENACPEEEKPKTCAAKIKISFNQKVYSIGDPIKIVIEVFDSQGNHLPNYAFYAQMYDDRWHTPNLERTDNNGYFIQTGTAEKSTRFTKAKFKVYTKEVGPCRSVEDTTEIELKQEEEVCGIGKCVPEPKPPKKIPIEPPKKAEIFYPCRGCELDDKCYPMGYRKGGKYCSEDYKFVGQLEEDSTCDNSFECKSNVCIDGECISGGLIRKIIKWFKKFIGRPEPPKPPKPEDEVDCSKLLIEKDIGDYEYKESGYGGFKESQAPLISDEGEQIGTIKCCVAQYLDENEKRGMALVCPYENREYVENLINIGLKQASASGANFILQDYKGENVYVDKWVSMVWAHENYAIAAGRDHQQEGSVFPEEIADAYLKKYPNDLGEIDIFEVREEEIEAILEEEATQNADGCGEITDSDARDECYYIIARENKDVSLCEKIIYSDSKDGCYYIIAVETKDISLCGKIKSALKDNCHLRIAEETHDASLCEESTDSDIQGQCYRNIALATKDGSLCDRVGITPDYDRREGCYFLVATKTKDLTLCDKITVIEPYKDACYVVVTAITTKNASICETYPNIDGRGNDFCYFTFAIETNDASFCEKIIDSSMKDECYEGIA